MAEEKTRTIKVLEALSKMTEPTSPTDIGVTIEVSPLNTGKMLYDLGEGGLTQKPDDKKSLWLITDKGRKHIENPPVLSDRNSNRNSNRPLRPMSRSKSGPGMLP